MIGGLFGGAGAVAGAFGGFRVREAATERGWPDLPTALAEDALALGLARTAQAFDAG